MLTVGQQSKQLAPCFCILLQRHSAYRFNAAFPLFLSMSNRISKVHAHSSLPVIWILHKWDIFMFQHCFNKLTASKALIAPNHSPNIMSLYLFYFIVLMHLVKIATPAPKAEQWPWSANKSSESENSLHPPNSPLQNLSAPNDVGAANSNRPKVRKEPRCDLEKRGTLDVAWEGAGDLAKAHGAIVPGYHYNIPHSEWLGKDWNSGRRWWNPFFNYRKKIHGE